MGKIINQTFFNGTTDTVQPKRRNNGERTSSPEVMTHTVPQRNNVEIRKNLVSLVTNTIKTLGEIGMSTLSGRVQNVFNQVARETFTVGFVGEFSRGKSTLINNLLGTNILPVANLPTTALMTRIRYGIKPKMVVFDSHGIKQKELPLVKDSWSGLTAAKFNDNEPEGFVTVLIDKPWLGKYGIELIDTPGAGDLSEKRAKVIGEALLGCESAIITVSAAQPLSLSEKLFIEQRLIANRTPFLALAITRLDLVPEKERDIQVEYIINKLKSWNINIPILIPDDIQLPSNKYESIKGMDKLRGLIVSWLQRPERSRLIENWLSSQIMNILVTAQNSLAQQVELYQKSDNERLAIISEKNNKLTEMTLSWGKLRVELTERCGKCYDLFRIKYEELVQGIIEKLQYEAGHTVQAQKWWNEDYPYRLKVEAANLASQLDNYVSSIVSLDAKWLNDKLNEMFKTYIQIGRNSITDKATFLPISTNRAEFDDLDKKKNMMTLGSAALSIAGLCCGLGVIATLGIGSGAGILSNKFLKSKKEEQQQQLKALIAKDVPLALEDAITESEKKIKIIYADIASESIKKEKDWLVAQKELIESSNAPKNQDYFNKLQNDIQAINDLYKGFKVILSC